MGIWDRLGNVVKSYLNDPGDNVFRGNPSKGGSGEGRHRPGHSDPDLNSAYEELDDYLNYRDGKEKPAGQETPGNRPIPAELLKDFALLGLSPEASFEDCKGAYKKLLKIHHPDKHSTHPDNMKKATEKSAKVNAAYKRLEDWFRGVC